MSAHFFHTCPRFANVCPLMALPIQSGDCQLTLCQHLPTPCQNLLILCQHLPPLCQPLGSLYLHYGNICSNCKCPLKLCQHLSTLSHSLSTFCQCTQQCYQCMPTFCQQLPTLLDVLEHTVVILTWKVPSLHKDCQKRYMDEVRCLNTNIYLLIKFWHLTMFQ